MQEQETEVQEQDIEVELPEQNNETVEESQSEMQEQQELDLDQPEQPQRAASDDDLENYSEGVKKRINKMTAKLREAERREQAALEYARGVQARLQEEQKRAQALDQSYVGEYKARVTQQVDVARQRLRQAVMENDADAMAEAQEAIARLTIEQERVALAERQQAHYREQPVEQPYQPAPQQQASRPDPRAESWASKNAWFGEDQVMTYAAFGIHNKLVTEEGFDPSSDEYYDELDRRIRSEFPTRFKEENRPRKSSPSVAPASRSGVTVSGRKMVKLTSSQVAMAKKLGVPLEEYAKYVKGSI